MQGKIKDTGESEEMSSGWNRLFRESISSLKFGRREGRCSKEGLLRKGRLQLLSLRPIYSAVKNNGIIKNNTCVES